MGSGEDVWVTGGGRGEEVSGCVCRAEPHVAGTAERLRSAGGPLGRLVGKQETGGGGGREGGAFHWAELRTGEAREFVGEFTCRDCAIFDLLLVR